MVLCLFYNGFAAAQHQYGETRRLSKSKEGRAMQVLTATRK
jgi:hypothetical protein